MSDKKRTFECVDPADVKGPMPLAVGLFGFTGTGKTESALRLATGMVKVYGGDVFFADSDGRRGLHYREMFRFSYIPFPPPHNALDFADLLDEYAGRRGVLVIDQMTEEHDGEDGLIDTQEQAKNGKESRNAVAWNIAKKQHKLLVRAMRKAMVTIPVIVCWRAQEKLDWSAKDNEGKVTPKPLGGMPIGSKDLPFEMTATYLLPPGAKGAPCLRPVNPGEILMTKIPRFFEDIIAPGEAFTEEHGEAMARWAFGASDPVSVMRARLDAVQTPADLDALAPDFARQFPKGDLRRGQLNAAYRAAADRAAARAPETVPDQGGST